MFRKDLIFSLLILPIALFAQTPIQQNPQLSSEVPIDYGLLIDNSGSLRTQIDPILAVAKAIVNGNKTNDRTFLVRFIGSDKIERALDLTSDKTRLSKTIDEFTIEAGQSAINDAVYDSAQYLVNKSKDTNRRRALILLTDGYERSSYYRTEKLVSFLTDKNIPVYVIAFTKLVKKDSQRSYDNAVLYLETLATESKGRAYFPNTKSELLSNSAELIGSLRQP